MNLHLIKEIKKGIEGKKRLTIKDIQNSLKEKYTLHDIFESIEILIHYGDLVSHENGIYENPFLSGDYALCIIMDNKSEVKFENMQLEEIKIFINWYDSKNMPNQFQTMSIKNICIPKHKICFYSISYKGGKEVSINNIIKLIEKEKYGE